MGVRMINIFKHNYVMHQKKFEGGIKWKHELKEEGYNLSTISRRARVNSPV